MTNPSCPRAAEILEAATDPERRPLRAAALAHLQVCSSCRGLASDAALVEIFARACLPELPAALDFPPKRRFPRTAGQILRGRVGPRIAVAMLLCLAFLSGRWSTSHDDSRKASSPTRPLVVHMESPQKAGLFSQRQLVIEPTRSPRGFLAALKPK